MKTDLSVVGLPNHDEPLFSEQQGKEWVSYGANDAYAPYLEALYLGSSIHSAVVSGVGAMIYGEGLEAKDRNQSDGKREQWLRLQTLLSNSDPKLLQKLAMDLKLYGQCYINTIWNTPRTSIAKMRHLPVHTMRAGVANSQGEIDLWYYKADWGNKKDRSKPLVMRSYSETDRTEASRVLQIKRYAPSFHYYGLPDYVGSTGYIQLDTEIQAFHLNNVQNGLFPSMLISFNNGVPTDDERHAIERKVLEKFQGADAAGKVLITFNDGSENQPTFEPIASNGSDSMYEYLSREVSAKVLSGHRVTSPLLFGVRSEGGGFGNNAEELRDSYSLFTNTVVQPFQELLLDGLRPVLATNGIQLDLFFVPLKPADFITTSEATGAQEYTGIQISAAKDLLLAVSTGELTQEQAVVMLVQTLQFPLEVAESLFAAPDAALQFSAWVSLQSYSDYPESVRNNAQRGIELNAKQGNKCAEQTGKVRAQQLAKGEAISVETIKRMYSYLSRAEGDYDPNSTTECGTISYLLWGGKAALGWSRNKLRELGELEEANAHHQCSAVCRHEMAAETADALIAMGEEINLEQYELIDSRQVDYADEQRHDALWAFARTVPSRPGAKDDQDNDLIKIRYRYMPNAINTGTGGESGNNESRDFCKRMVAANKIYRKRDIELVSTQAVNPGFGKGGSDEYSVWFYKGGARCHHFWQRETYLQRGGKISVNEARRLINQLPPNERPQYRIPENDEKVAQRPTDMPRKGFAPDNPNLPKDA